MTQIDKNIPIPTGYQKDDKYPFARLDIGDSFFVPNITTSDISSKLMYYKNKGIRLVSRTVTENGETGVRIWRTTNP